MPRRCILSRNLLLIQDSKNGGISWIAKMLSPIASPKKKEKKRPVTLVHHRISNVERKELADSGWIGGPAGEVTMLFGDKQRYRVVNSAS